MKKDKYETTPISLEAQIRLLFKKLEEAYERIEALETFTISQNQRLWRLERAALEQQDTLPLK